MQFRLCLLPEFKTQDMIERRGGRRILRTETVRKMATWSHFTFRTKLIAQAQKFKDVIVRICNEAYTSQTCGRCGHLHRGLGGAERFICPSCGLRSGRSHILATESAEQAARLVYWLESRSLYGFCELNASAYSMVTLEALVVLMEGANASKYQLQH